MAINWYPGHMHKATKNMREALPDVDVIIELLDCRLPYSSQNPMIAELAADKPCIKILSKADLADDEITARWQAHFEQSDSVKTLRSTLEDGDRAERVISLVDKFVPEPSKSRSQVFAMVLGIPNVGKSTLINTVADRKVAKTGNEPAITKGLQRIKIHDRLMFLDTPGILWPKIENQQSGYRLAASGAIRDTAIEIDDIAAYLCGYLLEQYPTHVRERFELAELPQTEFELLEHIGAQRGCLRAGGRVDVTKASAIIVNEFRAGALGAISLETPDMIQAEEEQVQRLREEKLQKEKARKARGKKTKR
ncbi:MAG: ribosome biogenesis GTPase YlqF [Halioglobus sp.]